MEGKIYYQIKWLYRQYIETEKVILKYRIAFMAHFRCPETSSDQTIVLFF